MTQEQDRENPGPTTQANPIKTVIWERNALLVSSYGSLSYPNKYTKGTLQGAAQSKVTVIPRETQWLMVIGVQRRSHLDPDQPEWPLWPLGLPGVGRACIDLSSSLCLPHPPPSRGGPSWGFSFISIIYDKLCLRSVSWENQSTTHSRFSKNTRPVKNHINKSMRQA